MDVLSNHGLACAGKLPKSLMRELHCKALANQPLGVAQPPIACSQDETYIWDLQCHAWVLLSAQSPPSDIFVPQVLPGRAEVAAIRAGLKSVRHMHPVGLACFLMASSLQEADTAGPYGIS